MSEHKLFIGNALMLAALVAGASYLQKTYDTDTTPVAASNTPSTQSAPVVAADNSASGWQISTSSVSTKPASVATTPATSLAPATPAPKVRRTYTDDDRGDDN